jgi:endonuclease/exonuclease/phosphatase family metal-dependent hydrolase
MPGLAMPDETYTAMFERILQEQEADMLRIRDAHPDMQLLWAGDFNQSLEGPNATGSRVGRTLVEACLTRLGMHAWNRNAPHAVDGLSAIDIICGPQDLSVREVLRIDPIQGGKHLSDHAGYVIDVDIA